MAEEKPRHSGGSAPEAADFLFATDSEFFPIETSLFRNSRIALRAFLQCTLVAD
jgi:hypothetical protein